MDYKKRIAVAITTGSLLVATLLPGAAFADTTVVISDNGPSSNNTVNVSNNSTTNVVQGTIINVEVEQNAIAKTGNNTANGNTNASVNITTGNATASNDVNVTGGSNTANITGCGCNNTTDNVTISGNGPGSKNKVDISNKKSKGILQGSMIGVGVGQFAKAKTGKNQASGNTGGGSIKINTGHANSSNSVGVTGPTNTLNVTP